MQSARQPFNHLLFAFVLILPIRICHALHFEASWANMQDYYQKINSIFQTQYPDKLDDNYHPLWKQFSNEVQSIIMGTCNPHFLAAGAIQVSMVRNGMHAGQMYEIAYLTHCIGQSTKDLLHSFEEPAVSNLPRECGEFNCSVNALGQLFYAARILEATDPKEIRTIVEFGGGYGCLAHIFNTTLPHATIYLIDIPELLAIQYLYLQNAVPHTKMYTHTDSLTDLSEPGIHLIPTYLLQQFNVDADLFVSNFALSEVPSQTQLLVAQKDFFNASTCYINGQLNNQGDYAFEHHNRIHTTIRSHYRHVVCQPFHFFFTDVRAYEILAQQ